MWEGSTNEASEVRDVEVELEALAKGEVDSENNLESVKPKTQSLDRFTFHKNCRSDIDQNNCLNDKARETGTGKTVTKGVREGETDGARNLVSRSSGVTHSSEQSKLMLSPETDIRNCSDNIFIGKLDTSSRYSTRKSTRSKDEPSTRWRV